MDNRKSVSLLMVAFQGGQAYTATCPEGVAKVGDLVAVDGAIGKVLAVTAIDPESELFAFLESGGISVSQVDYCWIQMYGEDRERQIAEAHFFESAPGPVPE